MENPKMTQTDKGSRRSTMVRQSSSTKVFEETSDMQSEVDRIIGCLAHEETMKLCVQSNLPKRKDIAYISWDEISTDFQHLLLGKGSYCHVSKAYINLFSDRLCVPGCEAKFALKCLKPEVRKNGKDFKIGAMDLAMEGEILSRLDHTNIIKLHGVSQHTSKTAYTETENGYFLVLDILEETLRHRLYELKRTCLSDASNKDNELRTTSSSHHLLASIGPIALGIANGLSYMHSKGVVLRDIKPDNIGFDADGTPKIFDFGFAREVHTLSPNEMAGSFRYMAPEVGQRKGATLSSDVYSFGVLLWEICSLRTPFKHVKTCDEFLDEVMIGGWRESTAAIPSRVLRELIEQCWDTDPGKRPPMKTVHKILKQEFAKYKLKSPREATASASLARNGSSPGLLTRENSAASLEGRWRFGSRRSRQSSWSDRSDACIPTSSSHGRSSTNSKVKNAVWKMLNPLEGKRRSRSNESFGHSNSTASFGSSGRTLE